MKRPLPSLPRVSAASVAATLAMTACWFVYSQHHPHAVELAYIGPGSGFAFISSFLTLIVGFFASLLSFLTWPFRMAWRALRRHKGFRDAKVKKIIFLGLDGLDPGLTERYIAEGKLPNLKKLAETGGYSRLRTRFLLCLPSHGQLSLRG